MSKQVIVSGENNTVTVENDVIKVVRFGVPGPVGPQGPVSLINPTDDTIPVRQDGTQYRDSPLTVIYDMADVATMVNCSVPFQTTENSLFYGETLKSNVVGDEVGYTDEISGNTVLNPYRVFDVTGSNHDILASYLFIDPEADADGWQVFQPGDSDTIVLMPGETAEGVFIQLRTSFNFSQRLKGNTGKLGWSIFSPSAEGPTEENPSGLLKVFDSRDHEHYADFDNPYDEYSDTVTYVVGDYVQRFNLWYKCNTDITIPEVFDENKWDLIDYVEIAYPFPYGARIDQELHLTFFPIGDNPVEFLGNAGINLPYFETQYLSRELQIMKPTDDNETSDKFNWSSLKIQNELDTKIGDDPGGFLFYGRRNNLWVQPFADDVMYDNMTSGLLAVDVQEAIDELEVTKVGLAPEDGNMYAQKDGLWEQTNADDTVYDNSGSDLDDVTVNDAIDSLSQYARGVAHFENNVTITTISAINTPVKIAGTLVASGNNRDFTLTSDSLRYDGTITKTFDVIATLDLAKQIGGGLEDVYRAHIFVNGVDIISSSSITITTTDRPQAVTVMADVVLSTNDYVEIYVENTTGTNDVLTDTINILIR